jgi:hypothetical protein
MTDLYRKVGRRYHLVGREWEGWPADGWWLVSDARQSLIEPLDSPNPLPRIQTKQYLHALIAEVSKRLKQAEGREYGMGGASLAEIVTWTLNALADVAQWEDRP